MGLKYQTMIGAIGAAIAAIFGGWDAGLITLVTFMAIDFIMGLVCAGVFKQSKKTKGGGLESRPCFKGLCRKSAMLGFVLIGYRLDVLVGTNYIRDAIIIGFCANELLSITENAGLMGVPLPPAVTAAVEVLKHSADVSSEAGRQA